MRCPSCSRARAELRAFFDLAEAEGRLLPLSARQARRLRPYLDACGARYARWAKAWAFPCLDSLRALEGAALTPAGRVSRLAEQRLQAAGIIPGHPFDPKGLSVARSSDRANLEPCPF